MNLVSPLIILLALAAWGAVHSLTASLHAKHLARKGLGTRTSDGLFRLVYNITAVVTFLPVMVLTGILPDAPLYRFPPRLTFITLPVQALALVGTVIVLWQVNLPRFLGLHQFKRWSSGLPDPRDPPRLYTGGMYGWVRHPLYFFSLLLIWLIPVMTLNLLAFNLGATAYFYIGSIFEERKLIADFGPAYLEHQRRVPRLFPLPPKK